MQVIQVYILFIIIGKILLKGKVSMDGIVSKDRVQEHGEVYTPDKIVCDMLNLTNEKLKEIYTIDEMLEANYLEPTCGNGNFLIRILDAKLSLITDELTVEQTQIAILKAVSSIYGIDILADNIKNSKKRMLDILKTGDTAVLGEKQQWKNNRKFGVEILTTDFVKVVQYILDLNIQCADALTGKQFILNTDTQDKILDKNAEPKTCELRITQYGFEGSTVGIRDIVFNDLCNNKFVYVDYSECHYLQVNKLKPLSTFEVSTVDTRKAAVEAERALEEEDKLDDDEEF